MCDLTFHGQTEWTRLLKLTSEMLHEVIEDGEPEMWRLEELASDIDTALRLIDGTTATSEGSTATEPNQYDGARDA